MPAVAPEGFNLSGQVAWISGASRGIGLAVVDMLPGARRALARRMLFGAAK